MPKSRQRARPKLKKATPRVEAMRAKFGVHYSDALGRAYASGLLGSDNQAKAMLDTGQRIARIYCARFGHGQPRCCLSEPTGSALEDAEAVRAEDRWLTIRLDAVRRGGPSVAAAFTQLVIDPHPDRGPAWLDRLVEGGELRPQDLAPLAAALEALEVAL